MGKSLRICDESHDDIQWKSLSISTFCSVATNSITAIVFLCGQSNCEPLCGSRAGDSDSIYEKYMMLHRKFAHEHRNNNRTMDA